MVAGGATWWQVVLHGGRWWYMVRGAAKWWQAALHAVKWCFVKKAAETVGFQLGMPRFPL